MGDVLGVDRVLRMIEFLTYHGHRARLPHGGTTGTEERVALRIMQIGDGLELEGNYGDVAWTSYEGLK